MLQPKCQPIIILSRKIYIGQWICTVRKLKDTNCPFRNGFRLDDIAFFKKLAQSSPPGIVLVVSIRIQIIRPEHFAWGICLEYIQQDAHFSICESQAFFLSNLGRHLHPR